MTPAAALLDCIVPIVRARLAEGVDTEHLDDFLHRNRPALVAVIEANLAPLLRRVEAPNQVPTEDLPALWSAAQRTAANLAAMTGDATLAAQGRAAIGDERRVLTGQSGWGGLSIRSAASRLASRSPRSAASSMNEGAPRQRSVGPRFRQSRLRFEDPVGGRWALVKQEAAPL